jgi:hypothetical protein
LYTDKKGGHQQHEQRGAGISNELHAEGLASALASVAWIATPATRSMGPACSRRMAVAMSVNTNFVTTQ